MGKMVSVVVTYFVKPGKKEEYLDAVKVLIEKTHQEEGCVFYDLFENPENPAALTLVEVWKDQAALDYHMGMDYFLKSVEVLTPLREDHRERFVYSKVF